MFSQQCLMNLRCSGFLLPAFLVIIANCFTAADADQFTQNERSDIAKDSLHQRIRRLVDGEVDDGTYSFVVQTRDHYWGAVFAGCTASIIGSGWAVTARHCFSQRHSNRETLHFNNLPRGQSTGNINIEQKYSSDKSRQDLALVRLAEPHFLSNTKPPILNMAGLTDADIDQQGLAIGYAHSKITTTERPYKERVTIRQPDEQRHIIDLGEHDHLIITGSETESGDSGGPLLYQNKIAGILSAGTSNESFYTSLKPNKQFIFSTMGLQWIDSSFGAVFNEYFRIGRHYLCRTINSDGALFGSLAVENNRVLGCLVHSPNDAADTLINPYQFAYKPYTRNRSQQYQSPEFYWQPLTSGQVPINALPVYFDKTGKKHFLCIKAASQDSVPFTESMKFPGIIAEDESRCRHLKSASDHAAESGTVLVLSYGEDDRQAVQNYTIPGLFNEHRRTLSKLPCYIRRQEQLQVGVLEPAHSADDSNNEKNQYGCHIDGAEYSHYELNPESGRYAVGYRWQTENESFIHAHLDPLPYSGKAVFNHPGQKTFCKIAGLESYGTVDINLKEPICYSATHQSSHFQLFSRTLPLMPGMNQWTAPEWQMVIEHKRNNEERYYCNGIKVNDWLIATSSKCLDNILPLKSILSVRSVRSGAEYEIARYHIQNPGENNEFALLESTWPMDDLGNAPLLMTADTETQNTHKLYAMMFNQGIDRLLFSVGESLSESLPLTIRHDHNTLVLGSGRRYERNKRALKLCPNRAGYHSRYHLTLTGYEDTSIVSKGFALVQGSQDSVSVVGISKQGVNCSEFVDGRSIAMAVDRWLGATGVAEDIQRGQVAQTLTPTQSSYQAKSAIYASTESASAKSASPEGALINMAGIDMRSTTYSKSRATHLALDSAIWLLWTSLYGLGMALR